MLRITALNDSDSEDDSQTQQFAREVTKEAKEAEAFKLYGEALDLLQKGETEEATEVFQDLIEHEFLIEAYELLEERGQDAIHPGLQLLYSIHKNLAAMAAKRKDYQAALDSYLEAVKIDNSEVTVWHKIGVMALTVEDYQLAMLAFEQGLQCNPKHWPCLDNIITVLLALNNYMECLYYISRAFEMDIYYHKGYALRDYMFSVQPSLKTDSEEFFADCDPEIHRYLVNPEEAQEYVEEALAMRQRNQAVCKPPEPELLQFPPRIKQYSWKHVGEILVDLYDSVMDPPESANESMSSSGSHSGHQVKEDKKPFKSIVFKVIVPDYRTLSTEEPENQISAETAGTGSVLETGPLKEGDGDVPMELDESADKCPHTGEDAKVLAKTDTNQTLSVDVKPENTVEISAEKVSDEMKIRENKEGKDGQNLTDNGMLMDVSVQNMETPKDSVNSKSSLVDGTVPSGNVDEEQERPLLLESQKVGNAEMVAMETDQYHDQSLKALKEETTIEKSAKDSVNTEVKMEEAVTSEDKKTVEFDDDDDDDSSSVQEAVMKAHQLLDSLSPEKSQYSQERIISDSGSVDLGVKEKTAFDAATGNKSTSDSVPLTKTSSYGFTVSDPLSEETEKDGSKNSFNETADRSALFAQSVGRSVSPGSQTATQMSQNSNLPIVIDTSSASEEFSAKNSECTTTTALYARSTVTEAHQHVSSSPLVADPTTTTSSRTTLSVASQMTTSADLLSSQTSCVTGSSQITAGSRLLSQTSLLPSSSSASSASHSVTQITLSQTGSDNVLLVTQSNTPSLTFSQTGSDIVSSVTQSNTPILTSQSDSVYSPVCISSVSQSFTQAFTQGVSTQSPGSVVSQMQSESQPSTVSVSSPARSVGSVSEHGYSRTYQEILSNQSTPKRIPFSAAARLPSAVYLHDSPLSASYTEVSLDIDDKSPQGRKAQKRKRPSLVTEDIVNYGKRRSARVRNTGRGKKEEETVNFYETLQSFLPDSLKHEADDESVAMETDTSDASEKESANEMGTPVKQQSSAVIMATEDWHEEEMVRDFLVKCINNKGLLQMCRDYLDILAAHAKVRWADGLPEVFMKVFNRVRKHLYIPSMFELTDPPEFYQQTIQMCLVGGELQVDEWMSQRVKAVGSTVLSPRSQGSHVLSKEDVPELFEEDLWFLTVLCGYSDLLGSIWIDVCLRVYWMKARYHLLRNSMEEAVFCFERVLEYLEYNKEEDQNVQNVFIPNCRLDNIVNTETVTCQLEVLKQTCSVTETEKCYEEKDYKKVVELLLQTFETGKHKFVSADYAERQSQLLMLLEALYKTQDYTKCLVWGEESFHECYQRFQRATKSDERSSWVKTIIRIFSYMHRVLDQKVKIKEVLPVNKISRLCQNLIRLVDTNMSLHESIAEMVIDSNIPWILLFHVIREEEEKKEKPKITEGENGEEEDSMPPYCFLLNMAHEYLGNRSWCTKSDGALLLFFMSVLKTEMSQEPASALLEEYQRAYEQCVFCLYGHPNKKAKAKHLQDHNATNIPLVWDQAVDLFEYFKPKTLPEFDGFRSETVSAEMENLLKRITWLIPENSKQMGLKLEEIQAYIDGSMSTAPCIKEERKVTLPIMEEIFYLLADYYLKNKEFVKANRFYLQDLCMNPRRLDSWAGMALARMSQLETKLTSVELKMDTPIFKKSVAALRCFRQAVEIENSNSKLWIEYGTLAYQLHSHASRQLQWKRKKWFTMDDEFVKNVRDSKREMLLMATDCFHQASKFNGPEDEWLHNYMLGKCSEKAGKPLKDIVPYYFQALECLHSEQAKYPKKITYAYNTPRLAAEALEMYYRIHVVILKLLLIHSPEWEHHDYKLYVKYIVEAANTPFRRRVEKGQEGKSDHDTASSADESSLIESPAVVAKQQRSDHTYFRQKSTPGASTASAEPVAMETSEIPEQTVADTSVTVKAADFLTKKSVTTIELHSEEPAAKVDVTMTAQENPTPSSVENTLSREFIVVKEESQSKAEKDAANLQKVHKSPFSISSILGEKCDYETGSVEKATSADLVDTKQGVEQMELTPADTSKAASNEEPLVKTGETEIAKIDESAKQDPISSQDVCNKEAGTTGKESESSRSQEEPVVRSILSHLEDLIEAEMKVKSPCSTEEKVDGKMEVDQITKDTGNTEDSVCTEPAVDSIGKKIDDQVNALLKLPAAALHKELIEKCRLAMITCIQRFPTHYKSYYRLAYLYLHSPYHKSLVKAHNIMLGCPQWKELDYMPCQGLFGERKQTKFFQGIWKIPIDEIERSGSFPSHLNRCIELALEVLKAERDSQTLHQVHLQLNRQPEQGKKYLRDSEKRYYALMSHTYTLDSVERQIEDMRVVTDYDTRLQFLMVMYKIHEHGVHKLNKDVERTKKLLADAYRVVVRKLETLPPNMLLKEAMRFCKNQLAQKKSDKSQDSKPSPVVPASLRQSDSQSSPLKSSEQQIGASKPPTPQPAGQATPNLISLANIMKSPITGVSLLKGVHPIMSPVNKGTQNGQIIVNEPSGNTDKMEQPGMNDGAVAEKNSDVKSPDVIVLSDSSVDSPVKQASNDREKFFENRPTQPSAAATGTVKIKMGLLQAVKRLKPAQVSVADDIDTSQDEGLTSAMSEDESEAPLTSATEREITSQASSSSSSVSSSSSSSSGDESSESSNDESDGDENESDDSGNTTDKKTSKHVKDVDDDDSDGSEDSSDVENSESGLETESQSSSKVSKPSVPVKRKLKVVPRTEDEEESSDNSDEIDLVTSDEEVDGDDEKDKDYHASEDESDDDVIMISDEEYGPKGKALVPSPPTRQDAAQGTEVLVKDMPDFDPSLISSLLSDTGAVPQSQEGQNPNP